MNWVVSCLACGSSYVQEAGKGLPELCSVCSQKGKGEEITPAEKEQGRQRILSVSTSGFANRNIVKTLGLVSHEHVFSFNLKRVDQEKFNEAIAPSLVEKISSGKELSIRAIEEETADRGGNAVVGVDITYELLAIHRDMVMVLVGVKGTAVVID